MSNLSKFDVCFSMFGKTKIVEFLPVAGVPTSPHGVQFYRTSNIDQQTSN